MQLHLLHGWRFSAFRDAVVQTSVAASGYLSSSHLRHRSVWTSSSCHCVDTASLKKKYIYICISTKLDHWDFKSGILIVHLEKIRSNHQGTVQHSEIKAVEHPSVFPRHIPLCFDSLHPPHYKKAPYLLLFPYQWFTHSRWRTHNKPAMRIHMEEVV